MSEEQSVRVRFAPSPTGYLHVGGLRTALYNYLFARQHNGTFVLRIEDTDRARIVEGAADNLIDTLQWAGLEFDEGPRKGGPFGPYIQSERLSTYAEYAQQLIAKNMAYRCFCSHERLSEMRKAQEKLRTPPKYDRQCLRLNPKDIETNTLNGVPFVVRMKIPDGRAVRFHDVIREDVEFASEQIDDQVLLKSDGYPTYHLANVIDDHLMKISHVIRGEEWLSSTPKHVLLYEFFGWNLPTFAHLPLLLNPDRSKLSKRQGDVAVEEYRSKGFLKEALINFVALLGWNPGTEQEIFLLHELAGCFSLGRVGKAGAVFNVEKLNWLNFQHLRKKSDAEVLRMLKEEILRSRFKELHFDDAHLTKVVQIMRERVTFVKDFLEKSPYFFEAPTLYDPEIVKKRWNASAPEHLKKLVQDFSMLEHPAAEDYEATLHKTAQSLGIGNAELIHAVRLAISGVGGGPGLFDILSVLGKDECIRRLRAAIENIR